MMVKYIYGRFLPCQLRDSTQQPFGYWPNALTSRQPATPYIPHYTERYRHTSVLLSYAHYLIAELLIPRWHGCIFQTSELQLDVWSYSVLLH